MRRFTVGLGLLAAAWLSAAAVRDVPSLDVPTGAPTSAAPAPAVSPILAPAPAAAPLPALPPTAVPAPASASVGSFDGDQPPDAVRRALPTDKPDGLRQLRNLLTARGETDALEAAQNLYYTDPLTGLPNRAYYMEQGERTLASAPDPAVALFDMDNFGAVNAGLADVHGVVAGRERADRVLAVAGAVLAGLARESGVVVARLGGEEFVALGSRGKVLLFAGEARRSMPPGRLLDAAGVERGGREGQAIEAAQARLGRAGQPIAGFTYAVAPAAGLTPADALARADAALNAAKGGGRRGVIRVVGADGAASDWEPPASAGAAPALPRPPAARSVAEEVAELEARLTPHERRLFREAAFRDALTLTRTYDYVDLHAAEWNREYSGGGAVVLSSARNLKQINDVLGHDAGDRYLRRLGSILRQSVNAARNGRHLDVQEPVRVASKEFLLVGRDADAVARLAAQAVADGFDGGRMLTPEEVARLREEVAARRLAPADRVKMIGSLRVVSEPIVADGRADAKAAIDRAFVRLEVQKRDEDGTVRRIPTPFSAN